MLIILMITNTAQKLSRILSLPHFHHHEKRSVTKTASSISLSKQGHSSKSKFYYQLTFYTSRFGSISFFSSFSISIVISQIDEELENTPEMSAPHLDQ